jgi:hypothetical protein
MFTRKDRESKIKGFKIIITILDQMILIYLTESDHDVCGFVGGLKPMAFQQLSDSFGRFLPLIII